MIEAVIIAFVLSKVKGYKVKYALYLKNWPLYIIIVSCLLYIFLVINSLYGRYYLIEYTSLYQSITIYAYIALIIVTVQKWYGLIATVFLFAGKLMNAVAVNANGGLMPVLPKFIANNTINTINTITSIDKMHALASSTVKFAFLGDWIDIGYNVLSPGDVLMRIFAVMAIYYAVKNTNTSLNISHGFDKSRAEV